MVLVLASDNLDVARRSSLTGSEEPDRDLPMLPLPQRLQGDTEDTDEMTRYSRFGQE